MPRIHHWKIGVVLLLFALPSGRAAAQDIYVGENMVFTQDITVEQCQQGPVILKMPSMKPADDYLLQIQADPRRTDITAKVALNDRYVQKYVPTYLDHRAGTASLIVSLPPENVLSVLVRGDAGASVTIMLFEHGRNLGNMHSEDGLLASIFPDIEAGKSQEIEFGIRLASDSPTFHINTVHLEEVDARGNRLESLGELHNEGNGIFGVKKTIVAGNEMIIRYFAFILNRGEATERTRIVPVYVFKHTPSQQQEWDREREIDTRAAKEFRRLKANVGQEEAIKQVIQMVEDEPRVIAIGNEPGMPSVWIEYVSGTLGGFFISQPRPKIRGDDKIRGPVPNIEQDNSTY